MVYDLLVLGLQLDDILAFALILYWARKRLLRFFQFEVIYDLSITMKGHVVDKQGRAVPFSLVIVSNGYLFFKPVMLHFLITLIEL